MKNIFSRWTPWRPSWILNQNDLTFFDLQVTPMFPTKLRVNWPFGSDFHDGHQGGPSWIFDWNNLIYFLSTSYPDDSFPVSSQLAFDLGE